MSPRAWLAFAACVFALGTVIGWSARLTTTSDRYLRALAERHEAYDRYLNTQADFIITNNTLERNKRNGSTKEN